jgi:DnaJ-domain-containing protein 1
MSGLELIVVAFGLFLGYWVVSRFLTGASTKTSGGRSSGDRIQPQPSTGNELEWHEVLDVSPSADSDDIKKAYKALMSQYHPDKVASLGDELIVLAEKKSKEITAAYRTAMNERGMSV